MSASDAERAEILGRLGTVIEESATEDVDWTVVTAATALDSFGFDSLAVLDLIFDLEQEFGVQIPAETMLRMKTVGDLVAYLADGGG
jgi:acyl carrier protein